MSRVVFVTAPGAQLHSSSVTVRADEGQPSLPRGERKSGLGSNVTFEFEAVYEEHFDLVWRTLRRLGVAPPAVDDALQDVFLVVYRKLGEFEQRSSLRTWLFGITLRVASDYLRRDRRHEQTTALDPDLRDDRAQDPLEQRARSEAVQLLYAALAELDPEKRAAFVLAELEEMTTAEVALAVGANINTVASRVRAGRHQFEAALRRLRAKDTWKSRP
jgi:RNA polymerase sigma-70 factor (ECF subfamily)